MQFLRKLILYKNCAYCNQNKPSQCFGPNKKAKTGLKSYCKECSRLKEREYNARPENKTKRKEAQQKHRRAHFETIQKRGAAWGRNLKNRFKVVRAAAARRGLLWTISEEYFQYLSGLPCHYCPSHVMPETGSGLDRIDNLRGYEPDNVLPCCDSCNKSRGNRFTVEEWEVAARAIERFRLQKVSE